MPLRLTGLYMLRRQRAARATKNRSRRTKVRLCAVLSPPHLGQGVFASQNPITCPKCHIQPER